MGECVADHSMTPATRCDDSRATHRGRDHGSQLGVRPARSKVEPPSRCGYAGRSPFSHGSVPAAMPPMTATAPGMFSLTTRARWQAVTDNRHWIQASPGGRLAGSNPTGVEAYSRARSAAKTTTLREAPANLWQAPSGARAFGVLLLVELRGFEPLTSAMRTNAAPFTRAAPYRHGPTSAQVTGDAPSQGVGPRKPP
jgi:hypothetical protein